MDFPRKSRGAAIGARLRRLSELIDGDATRIYAAQGIRFEQRWFGVLNQLDLHGPMSVSELAATLRISHASISQTRQSLEKAGVLASELDPEDSRRRRLMLTEKGRKLLQRLKPLWKALAQAARELDAEAGDVVAALDRLDDALARRSLFDRVMQRLPPE